MLRRNLREETGQALVELALVVPLFTVILFGAVEYGRLAYDAIEVTNAARAGAAYGAQNHVTAADTCGRPDRSHPGCTELDWRRRNGN